MCREASLVITKQKVFWSKTNDSHEDIIEEFGLKESNSRGISFVRVEIVPPSGDYSLPLSKWKFNVDQDRLPSWWDAEKGEKRARIALKEWKKSKILVAGKTCKLKAGEYLFKVYGTVNYNSGTVETYNKASKCINKNKNGVIINRSGSKPTVKIGT